jgi:hypothetical protein
MDFFAVNSIILILILPNQALAAYSANQVAKEGVNVADSGV